MVASRILQSSTIMPSRSKTSNADWVKQHGKPHMKRQVAQPAHTLLHHPYKNSHGCTMSITHQANHTSHTCIYPNHLKPSRPLPQLLLSLALAC